MSDITQLRIEAAHKRVADVFSKEFAFTIPAYQRPYAWETTQVEELLADLTDAMDQGAQSDGFYFLGSVVLVKSHGSPEARVVDGQQRLTTLTILFSVIRDLTADPVRQASRETYVKQVASEDEGISEALRLRLRPKDQPFFEKHIQTLGATANLPSLDGLADSRARIIENAKTIRAKLDAMGETGRSKLLAFLLQSCYLVVVEVPTDTAARRIFTVLNARGLDLIATDILKADLLERAGPQKEKALSDQWEEIETALGRDQFSDLFTHIRMIFERDKPRSALETAFPKQVPVFREAPAQFMDGILQPYADALTLSRDHTKLTNVFGLATANLVRSLDRLDNKDWLPPLLLCLRQYKEGNRDDVPEVIFQLERLAYFLFVLRADVNERMFRYADVLDALEPVETTKTRANVKERTTGLTLTEGEVARLFYELDGPVYRLTRVVKPLLLRLEQASTDGAASYDYPTISVEHVCPQTINSESQWAKWYPDTQTHGEWVHTLGNLVLLNFRKNARASNYDFDDKKQKYFVSGDACPFVITNEVRAYRTWTLDKLEERREVLLRRLARTWRLEDEFEAWWDSE